MDIEDFDDDIQRDLDDDDAHGARYRLAMVAQDLRNIMSCVNTRSLGAAVRRKEERTKSNK